MFHSLIAYTAQLITNVIAFYHKPLQVFELFSSDLEVMGFDFQVAGLLLQSDLVIGDRDNLKYLLFFLIDISRFPQTLEISKIIIKLFFTLYQYLGPQDSNNEFAQDEEFLHDESANINEY